MGAIHEAYTPVGGLLANVGTLPKKRIIMLHDPSCRILLVEDDASDAHLLRQLLKGDECQFDVTWVKVCPRRSKSCMNMPLMLCWPSYAPGFERSENCPSGKKGCGRLCRSLC